MACIIQSLIDSITRIRDAAKIGLATMEHFARLEGALAPGTEEVEVLQHGGQRHQAAQVAHWFHELVDSHAAGGHDGGTLEDQGAGP